MRALNRGVKVDVLDVLECLSSERASASDEEIARLLGISKSDLMEILQDLTSRGYLRRHAATRRYALGSRILSLARRYLEKHDLPRFAEPVLNGIVKQINESSALAIREGSEIVVIAQITCGHPLKYTMTVGHRAPLHATASGKIILAFESGGDFLGSKPSLAAITKHTITDVSVLENEIAAARNDGHAVCNEEFIEGVFAIAVPVFANNRIVAALSTAVPSVRMNDQLGRRILTVLRDGADEMSASLSITGSDGFRP